MTGAGATPGSTPPPAGEPLGAGALSLRGQTRSSGVGGAGSCTGGGVASEERGRPLEVDYTLEVGTTTLPARELLGTRLTLRWSGRIECLACGRAVSKSYCQGYCHPCSRRLARCDICVLRPERCHFHLGTCREPEWGRTHCMRPHLVYLANGSGLKVGITREEGVPRRWIEQGAAAALPIARTGSRRAAGFVEARIAREVSDRTDWRRMVTRDPPPLDLRKARERVRPLLEGLGTREPVWGDFLEPLPDAPAWRFAYPVMEWPRRPRAVALEKEPVLEGTLTGIKGLYLFFGDRVLNVRRHAGYQVELERGGEPPGGAEGPAGRAGPSPCPHA